MNAEQRPATDWCGCAYDHPPTEDDAPGALTTTVHVFATEAELRAWVAEDPRLRRYRGAQRRLPFGAVGG